MSNTTASNPNGKVLVIDDELGPRESLRILLKNDYQVLCAESVDAGLDLLRSEQPDVIVLDIRMPGKSGIEGLREIRAVDSLVSVIMLTGYGALETAQEAMRLGASDYLKKPFDTTDMSRVIARNVQRTRFERRRYQTSKDLEAINARLINELAGKDSAAASIGRRSAEIAHDLRNPLTTVIGCLGLLSEELHHGRQDLGSDWQERAVKSLEMIENSVWRCKELADLLMNLGKSGALPSQTVRLVEFVREIVKSLEIRAAMRGVRISVTAECQEVEITAHRLQLFRAFSNIMLNSFEAVPESTGTVNVECRLDGAIATITVRDNGCGITPEQLARIFEPYFTTKKDTGTGLGLFIAKTVIEDLRGSIDVHSSVGKGTVVTIHLPVHPVTS